MTLSLSKPTDVVRWSGPRSLGLWVGLSLEPWESLEAQLCGGSPEEPKPSGTWGPHSFTVCVCVAVHAGVHSVDVLCGTCVHAWVHVKRTNVCMYVAPVWTALCA